MNSMYAAVESYLTSIGWFGTQNNLDEVAIRKVADFLDRCQDFTPEELTPEKAEQVGVPMLYDFARMYEHLG